MAAAQRLTEGCNRRRRHPSTPDWTFPIRVRIVVPELGFGQRIDLYLAWLRELGPTEYAWWGNGTLYSRSLKIAARLLAALPELKLTDAVDR